MGRRFRLKAVSQWASGSGLRGLAFTLFSLSGISSVRSEAEQVTDALSNSAHTARNDI